MAAAPCDACGGLINDVLVVCPHCGKRRAGVATTKLSGDEVRALLDSDPATLHAPSLLDAVVLPHPASHGPARVAEIALAVVASPLIVAGVVALAGVSRYRRRNVLNEASGELAPVVAMTTIGGIGLYSLLGLVISGTTLATVLGVSVGALWLRALIRTRSKHTRDLLRIDKPEKRRSLPAARAVERTSTPAIAPPAAASFSPPKADTESAPQPGEQPRLLR